MNGEGGVVGINCTSGPATNPNTKVIECYNSGTIISKGKYVGGICGLNYDSIKNCHALASVVSASNDIGNASNNYYGKIIGNNGRTNTSSITYVSGNISIDSELESVYNIVNEKDSEIWSKSNLNEPKFLWEDGIEN